VPSDQPDDDGGFDELAEVLLTAYAERSPADSCTGPDAGLTPRTALIAALIYISGADGNLDDNEIGDVLRVVPDRATLVAALEYCKQHDVETFLAAAAAMLTPEQKLCLMLNAIDLALGDGMLASAEQELLLQYAQEFGIPEHDLQPHVRTLMSKNDLRVFE
jgi:uncharacterized tellurite resistance protein B-like protein